MLPYKLSSLMAYASLMLIVCICLCCDNNSQSQDGDIMEPPDPPGDWRDDWLACWSGTHNTIAYVHDQDMNWPDPDSSGIYIINPDGTGKQFFHRQSLIFGLDWSPDGNLLLFSTHGGLFTISYPDKILDTLAGPGQYYSISWSPDGDGITFAKRSGDNAGIYLFKYDGTDSHRIIPYSKGPAWSYADSIIYSNLEWEMPLGAICNADTSGQYKRVIYDNGGRFNYDSLKPYIHISTQKIVFYAVVPGEYSGIWKTNYEGNEPVLLLRSGQYPAFSPNGQRIVYTNTTPNNGKLWIINWDGSGARQLTEPLIP